MFWVSANSKSNTPGILVYNSIIIIIMHIDGQQNILANNCGIEKFKNFVRFTIG